MLHYAKVKLKLNYLEIIHRKIYYIQQALGKLKAKFHCTQSMYGAKKLNAAFPALVSNTVNLKAFS